LFVFTELQNYRIFQEFQIFNRKEKREAQRFFSLRFFFSLRLIS